MACGPENPLKGNNDWPAAWRTAADELPGLELPPGEAPSPLSGPELLASTITAAAEKPKLLTLGPLTNVASALMAEPTLADKVDSIYIMGGAVDVPGNVFANQVAEWNIWIDPLAAQIVLESGAPIVFIPLDATNAVPVTRGWFNLLTDNRTTPAANAVFDLFSNSPGVLEGGFYFWDELAAAVMVDDSYATLETRTLTLVVDGLEQGRTQASPGGTELMVAVDADADRFTRDLIGSLNGGADVEVVVAVVDPEVEAYFAVLVELGDRINAEIDAWFAENEPAASAIFGGEPVPPEEARAVQRSFVATVVAIL